AAGARNVNLFVPDMVIVCETPRSAAAAVTQVASANFYGLDERNARVTAGVNLSWSWIVDSYALAEQIADGAGAQALALTEDPNDPDAFRDVLLTNSPERVDEFQREGELAARMRAVTDTRPPITRKINQNSEFLGGYILANFVYPESNGLRESNTETWSDEDRKSVV